MIGGGSEKESAGPLQERSNNEAQTILNKLTNVAEVYENDFSILLNYMLKIKLLMECRHYNDALKVLEKAIAFAKKKKFTITLLDFYSCQTRIFTFRKDPDRAAASLRLAEEIRSSVRATPIQSSIYLRSRLEFLLMHFEDAKQRRDQSRKKQPSIEPRPTG